MSVGTPPGNSGLISCLNNVINDGIYILPSDIHTYIKTTNDDVIPPTYQIPFSEKTWSVVSLVSSILKTVVYVVSLSRGKNLSTSG